MYPESFQLPKSGEKVVIRRLEESDLENLYALESDPQVKQFLRGPIFLPAEQWIPRMRELLGTCEDLAVDEKASARFAGSASIGHYLDNDEIVSKTNRELRICLAKPFQGKRLGIDIGEILLSAAFLELSAERVFEIVHPQNTASLKRVTSLGFGDAGILERPRYPWQQGHRKFVISRLLYEARKPI